MTTTRSTTKLPAARTPFRAAWLTRIVGRRIDGESAAR
jgi:hypothetical protein